MLIKIKNKKTRVLFTIAIVMVILTSGVFIFGISTGKLISLADTTINGSIRGRVIYDDRSVDADKQGIVGATVSLLKKQSISLPGGKFISVTTTKDGYYNITAPAGDYFLIAVLKDSNSNDCSYPINFYDINNSVTNQFQPVTIYAGKLNTDIPYMKVKVFPWLRGSVVYDKGGELGTTPAKNYTVTVYWMDPKDSTITNSKVTQTDLTGFYKFSCLSEGLTYWLKPVTYDNTPFKLVWPGITKNLRVDWPRIDNPNDPYDQLPPPQGTGGTFDPDPNTPGWDN